MLLYITEVMNLNYNIIPCFVEENPKTTLIKTQSMVFYLVFLAPPTLLQNFLIPYSSLLLFVF